MPLVPFKVKEFVKGSVNENSGLLAGDQIIGINGTPTPYFQDFAKVIQKDSCNKVTLNVLRGTDSLDIEVKVNENSQVGIYNQDVDNFLHFEKREYGFFESIPAGFGEMIGTLDNHIKQLKYMFTSEGIQQVGGFGTIGNLFPDSFSDDDYWRQFWAITALLSVILAVMNMLPIPALDGGHVMFLIYEIIFRRKPGEKFMEYAQITGMVLLLTLMVYANGKDAISGFFGGEEPAPKCWEPTKTE